MLMFRIHVWTKADIYAYEKFSSLYTVVVDTQKPDIHLMSES